MNCTDWPIFGDAGPNVKDALRVAGGWTATTWLVVTEPLAFVTVNVTLYEPADAKEWLGFCNALVEPSLKFHDQAVGLPVDVSVNCTDCPAAGETGLYVNDAASAATTVTVRVVVFDPDPFVTVNVTVRVPAVV